MEDSMVADAVLWVLFAVAIVFIWCGCHNTRRTPEASIEPAPSFTHGDLNKAA